MDNESSMFVELFGNSPVIRVLDFMLTFRELDYPLSEIAKNSGVAWSTIHTFFPILVSRGVVCEVRQIGRAKLYKLNSENGIARELIKIYGQLLKRSIEEAENEMAKIKPRVG